MPSLEELERVVSDRRAMLATADALAEIRERQLYRDAGFSSFNSYLRGRWGFSTTRAYQLLDLARLRRHIPVENEHQARRIAPAYRADPTGVVEAFAALTDAGGPRKAVKELARECSRRRDRPAGAKRTGGAWAERDRGAQPSAEPEAVYVVLGLPLGQWPPEVRVTASEGSAIALREELERNPGCRRVIIRRCEVLLAARRRPRAHDRRPQRRAAASRGRARGRPPQNKECLSTLSVRDR